MSETKYNVFTALQSDKMHDKCVIIQVPERCSKHPLARPIPIVEVPAMSTIACLECGGDIPSERLQRRAKYCSDLCCTQFHFGSKRTSSSSLTTGQKGAIAELAACVDLMRLGYEVFRAMSPSDSCDIIILRGGLTRRIEVRTGYRRSDGSIYYGRYQKDAGRSDHYAVVVDGIEVVYVPELAI